MIVSLRFSICVYLNKMIYFYKKVDLPCHPHSGMVLVDGQDVRLKIDYVSCLLGEVDLEKEDPICCYVKLIDEIERCMPTKESVVEHFESRGWQAFSFSFDVKRHPKDEDVIGTKPLH